MNRSINWADFTIGFVVGIVALYVVLAVTPNVTSEAFEKREACEHNIPRSQSCVMIYVPTPANEGKGS